MSYKAGVCNLCGTGCAHFLKVDGGRATGVAPALSHPVSQGKLCLRGWHIHELLGTDQRIAAPLVRGQDGVLRPVSLETAVAEILGRLKAIREKSGETAVLASARSSNEDNYSLMRLARTVLGTNHISVGAEAGQPEALEVLKDAFGTAGAIGSLTDLDRAQYIVVVGSDITKLNPILGSKIHLAAKNGRRVLTLCSTRTQIAKLSSRHFQERPGTQRTALNAFSKALLELKRKEGALAESRLAGFKELVQELDALPAERIPAVTGIPYSEIQAEMELLARAESLAIVFSSGIAGLDRDTIRAITNVALLSGKMGKAGSALIPAAGICNLQGSFDMGLSPTRTVGFASLADPTSQKRLARAWAEEPFGTSGRGVYELLRDPRSALRALFVVDHDDGIIREKGRISELDLVVYLGAFENPFMELAHVVLPTAAYTEYDGTYTASDRRVQLSRAKVEARPGIHPVWQLCAEIARMAGRAWSRQSSRDVFEEIAQVVPGYAGLSHEGLAQGFGRHTSLPALSESRSRFLPGASPDPALAGAAAVSSAFPIALMTGKAQQFWHQNNLMRKTFTPRRDFDATLLLYPEGYIELNSQDAKVLGVRDKWQVQVSARNGAMKIAVKISDDVRPGTALVPYFIKDMIPDFFVKHDAAFFHNEESIIPIKVEKL